MTDLKLFKVLDGAKTPALIGTRVELIPTKPNHIIQDIVDSITAMTAVNAYASVGSQPQRFS